MFMKADFGNLASNSLRSAFLPSDILSNEEIERVNRCQKFLDKSPDPFHCVEQVREQLENAGFSKLDESSFWGEEGVLQPGGKYYFIRHGSSIVAFAIGSGYSGGEGFKILGAHTDSPNIKIKPYSKRSTSTGGIIQLNVEPYGGGLWHSWFDRDLSLSGRVITRSSSNGQIESHLVQIPLPIVRIPNLCIHLRTAEEREAFKVNKEDHLVPILCNEIKQTLNSTLSTTTSSTGITDPWKKGQEPYLLHLLSNYLNCSVEDIADFELNLYDVQQAARSGLMGEFLVSARLDNQASCFVLTEAIIDYTKCEDFAKDKEVSMVAFFDHEEVGSESVVGAGSTLIADAINRILDAPLSKRGKAENNGNIKSSLELAMVAKARSFIVSVDMAHAVHPNYANKHEKQHSPQMNGGLVIKSNVNQRYATTPLTGFLIREIARREDLPVQEFAVRNDCPCGSTIGPTLSTQTGIRAIDVGMPMLSMHSIREMMGGKDLTHAYQLFKGFLTHYNSLNEAIRL
eukprot:gene2370-2601_t